MNRAGRSHRPDARPILAAALAVSACSDSGLVAAPEAEAPPVDNRVAVRGTFCLDPPEESSFGLKVLFIIDSSGSMQFTDPQQGRVSAVQAVLDNFAGNPHVEIALVRFNESTAVIPPEGFTNDHARLGASLDPLRTADSLTNYQAALAIAFQVLSADFDATGPAERARTRYVVVFLTDGTPDPRCQEGCQGDQYAFCDTGANVAGGAIDWADFEPCEDYNQDYQILQRVRQIRALGEAYGVGDLRVNTAMLCPEDVLPAAIQAFGIDCEESEILLRSMAAEGRGVFRSFSSGEEIDYLQFELRPIFLEYSLRDFFAVNASALPRGGAFSPDSDGDGLTDDEEADLGTNPLLADGDGDGYPDIVETRLAPAGYDALDPALPGDCDGPWDEDGDGLSDCAERALGTDRELADSDGDGLPDGLEASQGTDPAQADARDDPDFDGFANADELRGRLNPRERESERELLDLGYRYGSRPVAAADAQCFDFEVGQVSLVTTLPGVGQARPGANAIDVLLSEGLLGAPADQGRWRRARLCARFIAPDYKEPASGVLEAGPAAFVPLYEEPAGCE